MSGTGEEFSCWMSKDVRYRRGAAASSTSNAEGSPTPKRFFKPAFFRLGHASLFFCPPYPFPSSIRPGPHPPSSPAASALFPIAVFLSLPKREFVCANHWPAPGEHRRRLSSAFHSPVRHRFQDGVSRDAIRQATIIALSAHFAYGAP